MVFFVNLSGSITIFYLHLIAKLFIAMNHTKKIINHQSLLLTRYKNLVEQAYNFLQTDSALSDISEYKAIKLLHKINKLKYLARQTIQQN